MSTEGVDPPPVARQAGREGKSRSYLRGDGLEFDRVAFFSDAIFAISMTLLIVGVEPPNLPDRTSDYRVMLHALDEMFPQLFSFFLAFLLLAGYWRAHHQFFATLKRVDQPIIVTNLFYLAFVAFLPFPTDLVGEYGNNPISITLFALTLAGVSGIALVMRRYAYRNHALREDMTPAGYRAAMLQSVFPMAVFLLSIPLAFWSPAIALYSWLLLIPLGILSERLAARTT